MKKYLFFIIAHSLFVTLSKSSFSSCSVTIINTGGIYCNGSCTGSLTAVANGVPPFHYVWSTSDTTATVSGLCAGPYSVVMTDQTGCVDSTTIILTEPPPILVNSSINYFNCQCNCSLAVSGGTPGYSYLWCDGSIGQQLIYCIPGACYVYVTDANGCTVIDSFIMNPPPPLTITLQSTATTCSGCSDGTASVNAFGGTPPYMYVWSSGQTTQTITGLSDGIYSVCVTDANNCTICDSVSVADPLHVEHNEESNGVKIFPNPFTKICNLEISPALLQFNPEFIITDLMGNKITSMPVRQLHTVIEREKLVPGIFFWQLNNAGNHFFKGKLFIMD